MNSGNTIARSLIAAAAVAGLGACQQQLRIEDLTVEQRSAAADVRFYENVGVPDRVFTKLGPVEATSCRNMWHEPRVTEAAARDQLRMRAAQLGADGIIQVLCTASSANFVQNCWQAMTCAGTAVKIAKKSDGRPSLGGSGTGFFINPRGDILTNAHVTEGCRKLAVQAGEERFEAPVLYEDRRTDLALLRSGRPAAAFLSLRTAPPLQLAEPVVAVGFPLGSVLSQQVHVTDGSVSALAGMRDNTGELQFTAPIQPGNSGGPLVDLAGHLVGVNTASLVEPRWAPQNVNFAVKASTVATFLDSVGAEYRTTTSQGALAKTEVAARTARATVKLRCEPGAAPTS